jgi:hypothetical protein
MNATHSKFFPWVLPFRFAGFAAILVSLVLGSISPMSAMANPHQPLSGVQFVTPGGASSGSCGSWAQACVLWFANQNAGSGTELWAKAGTYSPTAGTDRNVSFTLKNGVGVYGGFAGNETTRGQRNPEANLTTLSGEIGTAGIYDNSFHVVDGSGTDITAVLDGFTITGGAATGAAPNTRSGGGMFIISGSPSLSNLSFSNNTASYNGGGLINVQGSPVLNLVAFSGNTVGYAGGGMDNSQGSPVLNNVTFTGNTATHYGGGMENSTSSPTLNNVTFSGNTAPQGSGMYNINSSSVVVRNSILWGNTPDQIFNDLTSSATVSFSDVQGGYPGTGNLNADPRIGPLETYGGATPVLPLLPGSAAIDAGEDATCTPGDQRGVSRPQGTHCDIGAFESRRFSLTVTSGNNQSAAVNTAFAQFLTVSVRSAYAEPVNGGAITFTPPASGASALIAGSPEAIAGGAASLMATANWTAGSYQVTATARGADMPAVFSLTNLVDHWLYLPMICK